MCWQQKTTLADMIEIAPDELMTIRRGGRIIVQATAWQLVNEGRLAEESTIDAVEFAFSTDTLRAHVECEGYFVAISRAQDKIVPLRAATPTDSTVGIPMFENSRWRMPHGQDRRIAAAPRSTA